MSKEKKLIVDASLLRLLNRTKSLPDKVVDMLYELVFKNNELEVFDIPKIKVVSFETDCVVYRPLTAVELLNKEESNLDKAVAYLVMTNPLERASISAEFKIQLIKEVFAT